MAVLIGWALDVETLKRLSSGWVSMNPMAAVAFVISGLALTALRPQGDPVEGAVLKNVPASAWRLAGMAGAVFVIVIGVLKLVEFFGFSFSTGVDQWLFGWKLANDHMGMPNRMAPNAALSFVLIGAALSLLDVQTRRGHYPAQYLAAAAAFISLMAVIGYSYRVQTFYGLTAYVPMALHTALAFLLLSVAVFCARPDKGWMTIFTSESSGGILVRLLLPSTIVVIIVLGWLRLDGERHGLYTAEVGVALYTGAVILIFMVLVGWTARSLHGVDLRRRQTEEQVTELNRDLARHAAELEAANKELESFSYSVSHDLRAPLRHVQGFVELLANDTKNAPLSAKAQRYVKIIGDAAGDMGSLVDDLLAFSRVGRVEMCRVAVDLEDVVRQAVAGLEPEIAGRNVEWQSDPLPMVEGDPSLVRQVYANLIANALKYSRPRDPARIELGCAGHDENGFVILFVKDNGVGFDMQYAGKLFGVFQRLHRADEFEGTGIGLANVQRIVLRHGGRVWAESKLDEGASFFFTLKPVTPPA